MCDEIVICRNDAEDLRVELARSRSVHRADGVAVYPIVENGHEHERAVAAQNLLKSSEFCLVGRSLNLKNEPFGHDYCSLSSDGLAGTSPLFSPKSDASCGVPRVQQSRGSFPPHEEDSSKKEEAQENRIKKVMFF